MSQIKRGLDTGVAGVMIPMINTKEEAEQAISYCNIFNLLAFVALVPVGPFYLERTQRNLKIIIHKQTMKR